MNPLEAYPKRVLLHAAPLNNPREVAFFLASSARDARARVEHADDLPALSAVRAALEEALGMKFEGEKGEHFFRSTLVQTLFYGVFSAWVLWHKEKPARSDAFDWRAAAWTLHVPMIQSLFEQVATPTKLGPLDLVEVLDWTAAALNRVHRPAFFEKFLESHAVQYFYEPFLQAFDSELRKQLGIGFSPAYLTENTDGIREDWPRIPLPNSKTALLASAALGRQVATLLNTEESVEGVTKGKLPSELKTMAVLSSTLNLSLTAGWGHAGQGGVTLPGQGKLLTRPYRPEEQPQGPPLNLLGKSTHDIYLNDAACWRNVPAKVWDFTVGGYQVMKKWLSYREHRLLGRALTPDEAREVTHTARRLAALLLLTPALEANYATAKASATPLPAQG